MRMRLARLLVVMTVLAVALVAAPPAQAVSFVLDDFHSVVAGNSVDFFGTLTRNATDPDPVALTGISVSVAGLTVDDTPFFLNFPAFLGGFTIAGPDVMFTLHAPLSLLPGLYFGSASVFAEDLAGNPVEIEAQDFSVRVEPSTGVVPEPTSLALLGLGLAGAALRRRRAR